MREGEGAGLAASYPHQPTFSLSTSFLQRLTPSAGQMRQSFLIRCSDVRSQSDQSWDWRSWAPEEMRAWVQHINRQSGGGRTLWRQARDPPGLEASKKKRPGTGLPELEKMCFSVCLTWENQGLPMSSPCWHTENLDWFVSLTAQPHYQQN